MENCFGPQSAYPCQACKDLNRKQNEAHRAKKNKILLKNVYYHNTIEKPRDRDPQRLDDATNDAQLATLAQHLSMSEPSDYAQRQAARNSLDERWCMKCFLAFRSKQARLQHIQRSSLHFVCRCCNDPTEYATKQELRQHKCYAGVCCWMCNSKRSWPNRKALVEHKWEVHHTCPACDTDVPFSSKEGLRKHKQKIHAAIYCGFCDMLFNDKEDKKSHMDFGHIQCLNCQVYFKDEYSRMQHRGAYCHFCKQAFPSGDRKKAHMKDVHAKECEDCKFNDTPKEQYCRTHWAEEEKRKASCAWFKKALWNAAFGNCSKPKATPKSQKNDEPPKEDSSDPKKPLAPPLRDGLIDLYAVLKIDRKSSAHEIEKAAKERRIKTHPDRLERQEGLTEQEIDDIREVAKQVGWAADILTDQQKRHKYDRELRAAMMKCQHNHFWALLGYVLFLCVMPALVLLLRVLEHQDNLLKVKYISQAR